MLDYKFGEFMLDLSSYNSLVSKTKKKILKNYMMLNLDISIIWIFGQYRKEIWNNFENILIYFIEIDYRKNNKSNIILMTNKLIILKLIKNQKF